MSDSPSIRYPSLGVLQAAHNELRQLHETVALLRAEAERVRAR